MQKNTLLAMIIVTFFISTNFCVTYIFSADAYEILPSEETPDFDIYSVSEKLSVLDKPRMPYDLFLQDLPILETLSAPNFAPGEVIVKFKQEIVDDAYFCLSSNLLDLSIPSINLLNNEHGLLGFKEISKVSSSVYTNGLYKLSFSENADINSIIRSYKNDPNVEYAEPNYIYEIFLTPNDPGFQYQWALNQSNDCDIDAPDAWNITTGSSDVVVAVIDTGVDYNHSDLAGNIWSNATGKHGYDFVNDNDDPMDDHGHGTHCAGIIGSVGNNSIGISGVCWNISIMSVKAINSWGGGYTDDLANAIVYATDNGADIISMSWGGYYESLTIKSAIEYAYDNGVVLVAAAGNDNINREIYPAVYDEVISVAATDQSDSKASFSNWGDWIDVAAPGVGIYSTLLNDNYGNYSGTSMACPFVSGVAGLLISNNSQLSNIQIKNILKASADPITSDYYIGTGRVNAYRALLYEKMPLGIINTTIKNSELIGNVSINGTANGSYFTNYSLYYGLGLYPDIWTKLVSSETQVNNSILASWNTSEVNDGLYTIKLIVNSSKNISSSDEAVVKVNNVIETLYVGGAGLNNYSTIQSAVHDAGNGDTVFIFNGTYIESVMVNNNIEIIGEDNSDTSVIGNLTDGYAFWVDSDRCNISNLNIQDTEIGLVYTSNNNSLIQNNIFNNTILSILVISNITGYSISPIGLSGSSVGNTTIKNNKITNYFYGIVSIGDKLYVINNTLDGGEYYYSFMAVAVQILGSNNTISYNRYLNNTIAVYGLYVNDSEIDNNDFYNNDISIGIILSQRNLIRNNSIDTGSLCGVVFSGSSNNTIYNNSITNIGEDAVYISDDSYDNIFYFNNLKNNAQNAFDDCTNIWYNEEHLKGNYWDDYAGSDINGDGIGDNSYDINGSTNQDLYPLIYERTVPPVFIWVDDEYNSSTPGWNVDHFDRIQKAIDNVTENGSIYINSGTYYENIVINKAMNIIGEDNNPVINGLGSTGINISANFTTIQNLEITNCGKGIKLYGTLLHNISIERNNFYDCSAAIFSNSSFDNTTVFARYNKFVGDNISIGMNFANAVNEINATLNYWGSITGPKHALNNSNGAGVNVSDKVIFEPWIGINGGEIYKDHINITQTNDSGFTEFFVNTTVVIVKINISTNCKTNVTVAGYSSLPEGTTGAVGTVGRIIDLKIQNESAVNWPINLTMYYNQSDLDNAGISEDDLDGLFFWNATSEKWQLYNETGVNMTDITIDSVEYNGSCWANIHSNQLSPKAMGRSLPAIPTNFLAIKDGTSAIDLSWDKGDSADDTRIQRRVGSYPESISDGTNVYNGTGSSTTDSGLSSGTKYYYSAWSFNTTSGLWSINYAQASATTDSVTSGGSSGTTQTMLPSYPTNQAPTADAGGPYVGAINSDITFDGSGSFDPDEDTLIYTWDFGDGNTDTGEIVTHNYNSTGTYIVNLTVNDGLLSNTDSTTATITVSGEYIPPVTDAGGPYTGLTFEDITFDGSDSYDTDGSIVNYTWDFGDTNIGYGVKAVHSYNMSGLFNITLTVTDDDGLTDSNTTTITIILDSDGDGLADHVEELLGSNPMDKSDVLIITIENKTYFLVDSNNDSVFNRLYNPIGRITDLKISNDGRFLLDVSVGTEWDYFYNPLTSEVTEYEEIESSDDFPWLIFIIITTILIILLILFILYKKGYIWIEKYYE